MTTVTFNTVAYTQESLAALSGPELVALHNAIAAQLYGEDSEPVKRFSSKDVAVKRTWIQLLALPAPTETTPPAEEIPATLPPTDDEPENDANPYREGTISHAIKESLNRSDTANAISDLQKAVEKKGEKAPAEAKKPARRGTNLQPPGFAPLPCREGSKQAILLDTLARPEGATMAELIEALSGGNKPWTETTVRSGFGWDMKNKGYGVRSEFIEIGGETVERFFIVVPSGNNIPAHTPLKTSKPKADARQQRLPE